jgi:acylphosphatase
MSDEIVRVHVWVQGLVQNVGFRAHIEYNARQLGVAGWVRNVGYDTVEAVAEGERGNVDRFIESMKAGPGASRVNESKVEWENATGEFKEFGVKRSM